MHATRWHFEISGDDDLHTIRVDLRRHAGLHNFLNRFHARPHAGIAAHRKRMQPEIENILHIGGEEHWQAAGFENMIALMRSGGAFSHMIIARHSDHTAQRRRARHVCMLKHIGAAIHARTFSIPNAEDTIVFIAARRREA